MQILNLVEDKYFYELMDEKIWKPQILDVPSAVKKILDSGKSFCRLGDGECQLMMGRHINFQEYDVELAEKLKQILSDDETDCCVGIPRYYWYPLDDVERNTNEYHKRYYIFNIPPYRKFYNEHLSRKKFYIDACLGGYMSQKSLQFCEERFDLLKTLFRGKKLVFVAGETVFRDITYDFFAEAAEKKFISAPRINAWKFFAQIMELCLTYPKDYTFVLILGPTATVLAYELSKHGYTAYDVGHLAKDYDAFMKGADRSADAIAKFFSPD